MDSAKPKASLPSDRDALIAFLRSRDLLLPDPWTDDASLIRSGILDSVALVEVVLWLEARLGRPIDPTGFDLAEELDSVSLMLRFLERRR